MNTPSDKQPIFLINNKELETSFEQNFLRQAKTHSQQGIVLNSKFLSLEYAEEISIYHHGVKLEIPPNSRFFVRRWGPNKDATALLCHILTDRGFEITDKVANLTHDIWSSKLAQMFHLFHHQIYFPHSWVFTQESLPYHIDTIAEKFGFPLVFKAAGGRGKFVWKMHSPTEILEKVDFLRRHKNRTLYMIQEYIENEQDIRVIVFKDQIIAAISRSSHDGFYNNISQGGTGATVELTTEETQMAITATTLCGLDLAGVDIVRTKRGPLLFEVNKAPDIDMFSTYAHFDISAKIMELYMQS